MGRVFKTGILGDGVTRVNRETGSVEKMSDVRKQQAEEEANKVQEVVSTPAPNTTTPVIDTAPTIQQPSVNDLKDSQTVGLDEVSTSFDISSQGTGNNDELKELLKKK